MGLAVLVLLLALAVGAALGGRVSGLSRLPVRHLPWLGAAFACQLAGALATDVTPHQLALLASAGLAARFAAGNLHLAGVPLAAAGLLLNALVMAVNGGMPVSEHAAARAGLPLERPSEAGRLAAGPDTRLDWFAESLPVPLPLRPEVDSPGDLLVAAGVGLLVVDGMLRDRGPRRLPPIPQALRRRFGRPSGNGRGSSAGSAAASVRSVGSARSVGSVSLAKTLPRKAQPPARSGSLPS
ncbi:DUF5317 family protein [Uniformispora flossi]|uniref:DUF5317 family protein n=1 Tax=Uniformispora flossi TaxID=3390723 RepID=UPI003C2BF21B